MKTIDNVERGINPVTMTIISPQKEYWPSLGSNQQSPILKSCTQLTVLHRVSRVKVQICLVMESKHGIHGRKYWLPAFSVFCQYVFFISILSLTFQQQSLTYQRQNHHLSYIQFGTDHHHTIYMLSIWESLNLTVV